MLTATAVYGLGNLSLQVDQETDLLKGLTIAEGLTLQKVEIVQDEVRTVIDNPHSYTPEYPGSIGLVLTLVKPDGSTIETGVNNLSIAPKQYNTPTLMEASDFIDKDYSWFYVLDEPTKEFITPHLKISYHSRNRAKQDNIIYIIF